MIRMSCVFKIVCRDNSGQNARPGRSILGHIAKVMLRTQASAWEGEASLSLIALAILHQSRIVADGEAPALEGRGN